MKKNKSITKIDLDDKLDAKVVSKCEFIVRLLLYRVFTLFPVNSKY